MLRRFCVPHASALSSSSAIAVGTTCVRTFFGKGWDSASLDVAHRALLRKPEVRDHLTNWVAEKTDGRGVESFVNAGKNAARNNVQVRLFLAPHLGDPHRLLKAYSLTAYPILDEHGEQLKVHVDGHEGEAFADPDDDYSKVVFPDLDLIKYLAQELLALLDWEQSPRGAASLLESLYRGSEIPDHVFQTPAVIERRVERKP
jgi:hypothetical protein